MVLDLLLQPRGLSENSVLAVFFKVQLVLFFKDVPESLVSFIFFLKAILKV